MSTILVNCLHAPGRHSKWFDQQVARRTNDLYRRRFNLGVPRRFVATAGVTFVLWVESGDRETVGATMLSSREPGVYKVRGVAVREDQEGRGIGTALISMIDRVVEKGATVGLCVDAGTARTPWLLAWYSGLGFRLADGDDPRFPHTEAEILMSKVIM